MARSNSLLWPTPAGLTVLRTQTLDYFTQMRTLLRDDHVLFSFEQSMDFGAAEQRLMTQLCLEFGFDHSPARLPMYLSGASGTLISGCYGQHRRPVARSNWLLWPTPQGRGTL